MKRKYVILIIISLSILLNLVGGIWILNLIRQNISNIENQTANRRNRFPEFPYEVWNENGFTKKWVVNNVFTNFVLFQTDLIVEDDKLFFLGSLKKNDPQSIIIMNSSDGSIVWKSAPVEIGSSFAVDNNYLYIALNSSGNIEKVSLEYFQTEWEVSLQPFHSPCCLQIIDNKLQGYWEPNKFYVLSINDGSKIIKFENEGSPIFRLEDTVKYYRGGTTAFGATDERGQNIWTVVLDEEFWQIPVFDEEIIFIRSGKSIGRIYAIDRKNGDILWKSSKNAISSLAQSSKYLFYFTQEGALVGVNKDNGEIKFSVELTKNGNTLSNIDGRSNFEVAYEESKGRVYLLMGDSAQLFAFQVDSEQ